MLSNWCFLQWIAWTFAREFIKQSCKSRLLYQSHVLICLLNHESQFTYPHLAAIIFPRRGGGGGSPQSFWWGCAVQLETCTKFPTKLSDIPYTILDLREKLISHLRLLKLWHGSNTWSQLTMNDFDLRELLTRATNLRRLMRKNSSLKTEWYSMPSQKKKHDLWGLTNLYYVHHLREYPPQNYFKRKVRTDPALVIITTV